MKVKYKIIEASEIINLTDPWYLPEIYAYIHPKFWFTEEVNNIRDHVRDMYINGMNKAVGHYSKLEKSIKKEGFKNPVLLTGGPPVRLDPDTIPPDLRDNKPMLVSEHLGGSRIIVAQKLGLSIPCIVSDFVNTLSNAEILSSAEAIRSKFGTPDDFTEIKINPKTGVQMQTRKFYHIENQSYDMRQQITVRGQVMKEIKHFLHAWSIRHKMHRRQHQI